MIDDRLENWSRYYRARLRRNTCASLEGNYRSPWRQWVEIHEIQLSTMIDWRDAELVEQAWRGMLGRSKLILKYTYMAHMPDYVVCRKVGVKRWNLEKELHRAKNIIENLLTIGNLNATLAPNLNRASERISPMEADCLRHKKLEAA